VKITYGPNVMEKIMEVPDYKKIILDLFHPMTGHADGCLFKNDNRMPCQCGWSQIAGAYNSALRQAREIAAEHYKTDSEPMAGGNYDDDLDAELYRAKAANR